jgi:2-deoxy-D-gluconate 3-dehydrogenase
MSDIFKLFELKDKVAIVTGGGGLLGTEFCLTLASAGAKVTIADINEAAAQDVTHELTHAGHQALALGTDVTSPESTRAMVQSTLETFGKVDILVNCAALDPKFDPGHLNENTKESESGAFENYPLEAWKQALDVNLTGAFLCSQAVVGPMLKQGKGVIINLSSIYGVTAPDQRLYQKPGQVPKYKPVYYSVTKSGILGLTRYLAAYYVGKNIRVNAISPGGVYNQHDSQFVESYSAHTILGRMAKKDEMNGALLFLASDASAYMTGANLIVDGGWTAW